MHHTLVLRIICPHQLSDGLHTPDIRIRSFENMLELSQLVRGQGEQASRKDRITRTFVYVSDAVFFFPFVAGAAARLGFSLSESLASSSMSDASEAVSLALSSFAVSTFFFGAALDFGAGLVAFAAGFGAAPLRGA